MLLPIQRTPAAVRPEAWIGSRAPELSVERVVQGGDVAALSWKRLRGKTVLLEFWATWCAPCVESIGHLNRVAEETRDDDVLVVWITDEDEGVVRPFLADHKLEGWVALDTDRSLFESLGITGIPTSVLVDRKGVVRVVDAPSGVSVSLVREVVSSSKEIRRVLKKAQTSPKSTQIPPALFEVEIRPAVEKRFGASVSPRQVVWRAMPLRLLIGQAFEVATARLVFEDEFPSYLYDAKIVRGHSKESWQALLRQGLEAAFGVTMRRERRVTPAYVLTNDGFAQKPIPSARQQLSLGLEGIHGLGTIRHLTGFLENEAEIPVEDETGLEGIYRFDLKWDRGDVADLVAALEKIGLRMRKQKRPVDVIVVRKREEKSAARPGN